MSEFMFLKCSYAQSTLRFNRAYTVREFAKKAGCSIRTAYRYWDICAYYAKGISGETKVFYTTAKLSAINNEEN